MKCVPRFDVISPAGFDKHVDQGEETFSAAFVYLRDNAIDCFLVDIAEQAPFIRVRKPVDNFCKN